MVDIFDGVFYEITPEITWILNLFDIFSHRLTIPTTISPRYVPPTDTSPESQKLSSIKYSLDSPAPLEIDISIITKHKIKAVRCVSSIRNKTNTGERNL